RTKAGTFRGRARRDGLLAPRCALCLGIDLEARRHGVPPEALLQVAVEPESDDLRRSRGRLSGWGSLSQPVDYGGIAKESSPDVMSVLRRSQLHGGDDLCDGGQQVRNRCAGSLLQ